PITWFYSTRGLVCHRSRASLKVIQASVRGFCRTALRTRHTARSFGIIRNITTDSLGYYTRSSGIALLSPEPTYKMRITLLSLYLFYVSTEGDNTSLCGENAFLRCPVKAEPNNVEYRAVSWYRVSEGRLNGIVRWDRRTNTVRRFVNLTQVVECPSGDGLTLELRNLTAKDRGVYRCLLRAPVGQINREWDIQLSVTGCSDEVDRLGSYEAKEILLYGGAGAGAFLLLAITLSFLYVSNSVTDFFLSNKNPLKLRQLIYGRK
ncbi:hypothetical protein SKAU_G00379460, partial [Synaphobranchus kaupii]